MEMFLKVSTSMISKKEKEYTNGVMGRFTRDTSKMI
jgi:hypothetical protein